MCFAQELPRDDEIRIAEGIRLALKVQDKIWPGWSKAPFGILLVTNDGEFLVNHPKQPEGFTKAGHSDRIGSAIYFRPRKFPLTFLATFPVLGDGVPVVVIGQAQNTDAKTSTPWVITLMHEHFHQLQYSQPDYQDAVARLNLAKGDTTGMWMLNYPFPYEKQEVVDGFDELKAALLKALQEKDKKQMTVQSNTFLTKDSVFFRSQSSPLSGEDVRYFNFQLWQEGVARYTQIKVAEAASKYQASDAFKGLRDYESFATYAKRARTDTENELRKADIAKWQRVVVYSYGACEALLLDRINPEWKAHYFRDAGLLLESVLPPYRIGR